MRIHGYCLLILGVVPAYRIVFKPSLSEAVKAIPKLKMETGGRIEILRMIDNDTNLKEEEDSNVDFKD